mgnify:FL=1
MKKYKFTDVSYQKVIYEAIVEAKTEDEALEKADWIEVSNELKSNQIESEEIKWKINYRNSL